IKALLAAVALVLIAVSTNAQAVDRATVPEAEAMVKKAVEYYKKHGRAAALAEFSKVDGKFVDRDLYVTVYALDGQCLSHINKVVIGKNMWEQRDIDGKYFTRERLEAAKTQPSGWQEFKYFNPLTKKIEPKRQYWQRYDDLVFAVGAYKES
ncbi:MAG: cache domain-containing protein, partial [Usitatibacter sp.]